MDEEFIKELKAMNAAQLALVDHDIYKWRCCAEGCNGFTRIKDFGLDPEYLTRWGWLNLNERVMYCGNHNKIYKAWNKKPKGESNHFPFSFKPGTGIFHLDYEKKGLIIKI